MLLLYRHSVDGRVCYYIHLCIVGHRAAAVLVKAQSVLDQEVPAAIGISQAVQEVWSVLAVLAMEF